MVHSGSTLRDREGNAQPGTREQAERFANLKHSATRTTIHQPRGGN